MEETLDSSRPWTRDGVAFPTGFVSPELVLVDPELAELVRKTMPVQPPAVRAAHSPPPTAVGPPWRALLQRRRPLAFAAAVCGAAALGVLGFFSAGPHRQSASQVTSSAAPAAVSHVVRVPNHVSRLPAAVSPRPAAADLISRDTLAGVRIGDSPAQVVRRWGRPATRRRVATDSRTAPVVRLTWQRRRGRRWRADAYFRSGHAVMLRLALRGTSSRTAFGDRAGSTARAFLAHWPDASPLSVAGPRAYFFVLTGRRGYLLVFTFVRGRLTRASFMTQSMFTGCNSGQC
jgi:hypothetical protein